MMRGSKQQFSGKKKRKERKEKKKRKKGQVVGEKNKGGMGEEISHFDQVGEGGIKKRRRKIGEKEERGRRAREDFSAF